MDAAPAKFHHSVRNTALGRKNAITIAMVMVVLAFLAYSNTFGNPFIFDDANILENDTITDFNPPWKSLFPPTPGGLSGRPIINFTLAVNYAISGLNVWSYHLFNIIIHTLAGLVLLGIIRRTTFFTGVPERYARVSVPLALAVSAIWMLHPLQTESVTYTIQRCESLMGLCFFLTLYCGIRGWQSDRPRPWHLSAILFCLVAVGMKEVIITAPPAVFLYDLVYVNRRPMTALKRSPLLYAGLFFVMVFTAFIALLGGTKSAFPSNFDITWYGYAWTQTQVILRYLWLTIWPVDLCLDYGWPVADFFAGLPHAIGFTVLLIAALLFSYRRPRAGYPVLWTLLILAPTSSVLPIPDLAFEHRMYLPLAGLATLFVVGAFEAVRLAGRRFGGKNDDGQAHLFFGPPRIALVVIVALLGILTFFRNADYQKEVVLWTKNVRQRPDNARPYYSLGQANYDLAQYKKAVVNLKKALSLLPKLTDARITIGAAYAKMGRPADALPYLEKAVKDDPRKPKARLNLGAVYLELGLTEESMRQFKAAIAIDPDFAEARTNMGVAMLKLGRVDEAIRFHREALQIDPELTTAHSNLALVLFEKKSPYAAMAHYLEAIDLAPENVNAYTGLGDVFLSLDQPDRAESILKDALKLVPENKSATLKLATAYLKLGKTSEAVNLLKPFVKKYPDNEEAAVNLAAAYLLTGRFEDASGLLRDVVAKNPKNADAHANLGVAYHQLGRPCDAERQTREALRINPDHQGALGLEKKLSSCNPDAAEAHPDSAGDTANEL